MPAITHPTFRGGHGANVSGGTLLHEALALWEDTRAQGTDKVTGNFAGLPAPYTERHLMLVFHIPKLFDFKFPLIWLLESTESKQFLTALVSF